MHMVKDPEYWAGEWRGSEAGRTGKNAAELRNTVARVSPITPRSPSWEEVGWPSEAQAAAGAVAKGTHRTPSPLCVVGVFTASRIFILWLFLKREGGWS